jgi:Flp pilus assembly pilin Flp
MLEHEKPIQSFTWDEDGAVTVDWVILAAAVALLSIPVLTAVNASVQTGANSVAEDMENAVND